MARAVAGAALGAALLVGLGAASGAAPTTGAAYARSLSLTLPIPPGASGVPRLAVPLSPVIAAPRGEVDYRRGFVVPESVDVAAFLRAHRVAGESALSTGQSDEGTLSVTTYDATLTCASRHTPACGVSYTVATVGGRQEMLVDVIVAWEPIVVESMPASGVVRVTGYDHLSLMNASSGATTVTLDSRQAAALRAAVSSLKVAAPGACMEDSQLLVISVSSSGRVTWRATVDACPGVLRVSAPATSTLFDARECVFARLAAGLFVKGTARGSVSDLRSCL
ncbi:MAG: hypothetical protein ACRDV0_05200 [Acidimicrobiales bacterium]